MEKRLDESNPYNYVGTAKQLLLVARAIYKTTIIIVVPLRRNAHVLSNGSR